MDCYFMVWTFENYHNVNLNYVQSVPVDCEVFQGSSTITVEHLTGEVKPVERKVGDSIPGGARNLDGMMIVKVCLHSCTSYFIFFLISKPYQSIRIISYWLYEVDIYSKLLLWLRFDVTAEFFLYFDGLGARIEFCFESHIGWRFSF